MLTGWDAAPCLNNLPGRRAISFHDVSSEVPAPTSFQETRTGYRVSPRVELAGWESGVPGARKSPEFLARNS